jgi:glycosyltransferase involved in cell wall biosynthesis
MKHKPFFSVAIPAYGYNGKGGEFLDFNLKILSNQTFKDFEVVISDHSIDDTIKNTLKKWLGKLKITYVTNDKGRGIISPNLNNAMKHCSGEYIKVLFQDDFLYNDDALKLQFDALNSKPRIKWLITTFQHSNDGVTFYRLYHPRLSPNIWNGTNTLGNPSNLTILNEDLIYFDEKLNWLVDCEYYYRLFLKHGEPTILKDVTVVNRTHGGGLSDTISQSLKDDEFNRLRKKYA